MGLFSRRDNPTARRAFARRDTVDVDVPHEAFHGVLRSELDEPDHLPEPFEQLIALAADARHRFEKGEISKAQLAGTLQRLRVTGPDGTEWTLGATSGRWYKRPVGGTWVPATPPAADAVAASGQGANAAHVQPTGFSTTSYDAARDEDDPFAALDELLRDPGSFDVAASVAPITPVNPWPEVSGEASSEEPVAYSVTSSAAVDEFGAWDSTWESVDRTQAVDGLGALSAFAAPVALDAFSSPPPVVTGHESGTLAAFDDLLELGDPGSADDIAPRTPKGTGEGWSAWGITERPE